MSITRLGRFSTASRSDTRRYSRFSVIFWFSLSLCFATGYGIVALLPVVRSDYVVSAQAQPYLFWMYRFLDPQLFPHDLIANYFQSITPPGYAALHQLMASVGITPILLSKFLPLVLGLITTGYCFAISMQILPIPIAGFISTLLLNQALWMQDNLVSDTPIGFLCPLFLAFLYYLVKRSLLPCLLAIALGSLFYPLTAPINSSILLLRLFKWQTVIPDSSRRQDLVYCVLGICVALLSLLPYIFSSSESWSTIAALERQDNNILTWLSPPQLLIGLLLPILLRFSTRFPLTTQVKSNVQILPQVVIVSLIMLFVAQEAFEINFPSRYAFYLLQIPLALAAGITLTLILDAIFDWSEQRSKPYIRVRQLLALLSAVIIVVGLILYPYSLKVFPKTQYVEGKAPKLYQFLEQQPKASLVASLSNEIDNLPIFAKRPILIGKEYTPPVGTKYYKLFHQRLNDLILAQYSTDIKSIKTFINQYGINFWLLDSAAFKAGYMHNSLWIKQYEAATTAKLKKTKPALLKLIDICKVYERDHLILLETKCIQNKL